MRIVRNLAQLQDVAERRLLFLKALVYRARNPSSPNHDRRVAFVSVEAANFWSQFCRCYFLSCALQARRMAGGRVSTSIRLNNVEDALTVAVQYKDPRKTGTGPWNWSDEPTWRKPTTVTNLLSRIGASNYSQVQAAFGYSTTVYTYLPAVRNFFCHRCKETADKLVPLARSTRMPSRSRATDILCSASPTATQSLLCEWIDDLRYVAKELCQ